MTTYDLEGFILAKLGTFSVWYTGLRAYIPFLALFSLAVIAVHFYERHSSAKGTQTAEIRLKTMSVLTYSAVMAAVTAVALWDIAVLVFVQRTMTEADVGVRLTFSLRPGVLAVENFLKYLSLFLVPFALLLRTRRPSLLSLFFARPRTPFTRTLLLSIVCASAIMSFGMIIVYPYIVSGRALKGDPILSLSLGGLTQKLMEGSLAIGLAYALALVSLIAASEELLFRGIIYSGLRERIGSRGALVLGSAMFAAYHESRLGSLFMVHFFIAGACLTWLYERTRSLYPAVAVHAALLMLSMFLGLALRR